MKRMRRTISTTDPRIVNGRSPEHPLNSANVVILLGCRETVVGQHSLPGAPVASTAQNDG